MLYAYQGVFEDFQETRDLLEIAGVAITFIRTVDDVIQVETESAIDPVVAEHALLVSVG